MWVALLSGVAVAASCGFRAFLPLLALGLASRAGVIQLRGGTEWLAGDLAIAALLVATVFEVAADKIPVVDHALDAMATVLRPAAAWVGSYAVLSAWPTPWAQIAAIVLGTMALALHGMRASLRLGSTTATLGAANPLLSLLDDAIALLLLAAAIFGSVVVLVALGALVWLRVRRRPRAITPASGADAGAPLAPAPPAS